MLRRALLLTCDIFGTERHVTTHKAHQGLDIFINSIRRLSTSVTDDFNLLPPSLGTVQVTSCLEGGFIVSDVQVEGSIICVGDLWLRWKPRTLGEITEESLALLDLIKPVPELLVLGSGATMHQQVPPHIMKALEKRYVSVELLDTKNATSTFNILNQEGRKVVGAFVPISVKS